MGNGYYQGKQKSLGDPNPDKISYYNKKDINNIIQNLIGNSPETLDTIQELAQAIDNNPEFYKNVMKLPPENASVQYRTKMLEFTQFDENGIGVLTQDMIDNRGGVKYILKQDCKITNTIDFYNNYLEFDGGAIRGLFNSGIRNLGNNTLYLKDFDNYLVFCITIIVSPNIHNIICEPNPKFEYQEGVYGPGISISGRSNIYIDGCGLHIPINITGSSRTIDLVKSTGNTFTENTGLKKTGVVYYYESASNNPYNYGFNIIDGSSAINNMPNDANGTKYTGIYNTTKNIFIKNATNVNISSYENVVILNCNIVTLSGWIISSFILNSSSINYNNNFANSVLLNSRIGGNIVLNSKFYGCNNLTINQIEEYVTISDCSFANLGLCHPECFLLSNSYGSGVYSRSDYRQTNQFITINNCEFYTLKIQEGNLNIKNNHIKGDVVINFSTANVITLNILNNVFDLNIAITSFQNNRFPQKLFLRNNIFANTNPSENSTEICVGRNTVISDNVFNGGTCSFYNTISDQFLSTCFLSNNIFYDHNDYNNILTVEGSSNSHGITEFLNNKIKGYKKLYLTDNITLHNNYFENVPNGFIGFKGNSDIEREIKFGQNYATFSEEDATLFERIYSTVHISNIEPYKIQENSDIN